MILTSKPRFILALPLGSRFCANVFDGCNKKQSFLQQDFQIHFKVTRKSFKFILGLAWGSIKDYKVGNFVTNLKFKDQTFIKITNIYIFILKIGIF